MTQMVFLGVGNNTAAIYRGSSTSLVQMASITSTFNDVNWELRYDQSDNTFKAFKAGKPTTLKWTDSGNVIKHSDDYQYGGIRIERAGLVNGPSLDNWVLKDWV